MLGRSQVIAQGRAVTNDYVIVSAPGRLGGRGSVHVYTYSDDDGQWRLLQTVTSDLWSLGECRGRGEGRDRDTQRKREGEKEREREL